MVPPPMKRCGRSEPRGEAKATEANAAAPFEDDAPAPVDPKKALDAVPANKDGQKIIRNERLKKVLNQRTTAFEANQMAIEKKRLKQDHQALELSNRLADERFARKMKKMQMATETTAAKAGGGGAKAEGTAKAKAAATAVVARMRVVQVEPAHEARVLEARGKKR